MYFWVQQNYLYSKNFVVFLKILHYSRTETELKEYRRTLAHPLTELLIFVISLMSAVEIYTGIFFNLNIFSFFFFKCF